MIDKDIKDYCKNCDVEPPAMKFKCPECEHNPDKEQIICKYKFRNKEKFDGKPYCTCFCELCEDLPICVHNCQIFEDYKKLARKTQIINEIEEVIKPYQEPIELDALSLVGAIKSILERKTQECESLKEEIEILKDNFDTATRDCNELIEELRQECEELKGKYKNVLDLAKQNADANEYCLQELEQENYRYRKALEEIEEICKNGVYDEFNMPLDECDFILDIINKAKGKE